MYNIYIMHNIYIYNMYIYMHNIYISYILYINHFKFHEFTE